MMSCSTASTGASACQQLLWTPVEEVDLWHLPSPWTPCWGCGHGGKLLAQPTGSCNLGSPHPLHISLPSCLHARLLVLELPAHHQLQTPLLLLYHHREPSCPAVPLLPRPLWGVCPPDALWPWPPASHLPQGSLACPLPGPPR